MGCSCSTVERKYKFLCYGDAYVFTTETQIKSLEEQSAPNANNNSPFNFNELDSKTNSTSAKEKKTFGFAKKIKSRKMLNLLAIYIEAKTGLYANSSEKEAALISKGMNQNSLDNFFLDEINYNIKKITKIYKNQNPPGKNDIFTDQLFPPNKDSILGIKNGAYVDKVPSRLQKSKKEFLFDIDNIIWLRASEIFKCGKFSIFVDDVSVDDVLQGNLGNCYFMSSLAAMTTTPQLIYQIFRTINIPDNHCYEIGLNIEGEWRIVLLDDYFPCSKKTRVPIFAKPNGPELWAMLLEKAWAKVNGGYLNITGGFACEVLETLTSFPTETIKLKPDMSDSIWDQFNSAFKEGQIISCCSNFNKEIEKFGLISGHSFTVTNLTDGFVEGDLVRLIRLRNPWGYREWNGPWSDHSPLWTEKAKSELGVENVISDDGEFWMSLEDFFKYFCVVDISKVTNPQCVKTFQIPHKDLEKPNVFEMHIYSKTEAIISVYKKNYRFHRTMKTNEELCINLIICKKGEDNRLELVGSTNENITNPMLNVTLTVGYYLIYVHCNYKYSTYEKQRKVRLYISANKFFSIYQKVVDIKYNLLKHIILSNFEKDLTDPNSKKDISMVTSNTFKGTSFSYLVLCNKASEKIRFTVINISQNVYIFDPFYENIKEIDITIPPGKLAVFVGIRKLYYEEFKMSLSIIRHSSAFMVDLFSSVGSTLKLEQFCSANSTHLLRANFINEEILSSIPYFFEKSATIDFLTNCDEATEIKKDYDFIYKKVEIQKEKINEKINYKQNAENFFLKKYPKEMKMILEEVEKVNDDENVIFRDVFDYGDSCYIGEWAMKKELTRHGRGLLINSDGSSYLGQFKNNKREGKGKFFYNNGETIDITWKNNLMDGIGIISKLSGETQKVFYENGKLIC